jgi:hypothetical protein
MIKLIIIIKKLYNLIIKSIIILMMIMLIVCIFTLAYKAWSINIKLTECIRPPNLPKNYKIDPNCYENFLVIHIFMALMIYPIYIYYSLGNGGTWALPRVAFYISVLMLTQYYLCFGPEQRYILKINLNLTYFPEDYLCFICLLFLICSYIPNTNWFYRKTSEGFKGLYYLALLITQLIGTFSLASSSIRLLFFNEWSVLKFKEKVIDSCIYTDKNGWFSIYRNYRSESPRDNEVINKLIDKIIEHHTKNNIEPKFLEILNKQRGKLKESLFISDEKFTEVYNELLSETKTTLHSILESNTMNHVLVHESIPNWLVISLMFSFALFLGILFILSYDENNK